MLFLTPSNRYQALWATNQKKNKINKCAEKHSKPHPTSHCRVISHQVYLSFAAPRLDKTTVKQIKNK